MALLMTTTLKIILTFCTILNFKLQRILIIKQILNCNDDRGLILHRILKKSSSSIEEEREEENESDIDL